MVRSVSWVLLILACTTWRIASASAVPLSIKDYIHTAWTQREGAPADVHAMVQTPDGWYWLGSSTGLYRFDGVSFERHLLFPSQSDKSESVASFYLSEGGDLWVSLTYGGLLELKGSDYSTAFFPSGLPGDMPVDSFCEDAQHRLWAIASNEIYRLEGDHWQHLTKARLGIADDNLDKLEQDAVGTLWLNSDKKLYFLRKGEAGFRRYAGPLPMGASAHIWKANDGSFWVRQGLDMRLLNLPGGPVGTGPGVKFDWSSVPRVIDRDGTMWLTDCAVALLCRYPQAAQTKDVVSHQAFQADSVKLDDNIMSGISMTALMDRNGDLWVGTKAGIDRFHKPVANVVHFPSPMIYFAATPNPDGSMWVGTASNGYDDRWWLVDGHAAPHAWSDFHWDTTASFRDADGRIWTGGESGLRLFDGKQMLSVGVPESMKGRKIQGILRDGTGRLWIAFRGAPVFQLVGNTWLSKGGVSALPNWHPIVMAADEQGSAWFGYSNSDVSVLHGNVLTTYSNRDGLHTGSVTAIWPKGPILIGGELGLAAFDGRQFRMLQTTVPGTLMGITGIELGKDGRYWLNAQIGAIRIRAEDVQRAIRDTNYEMPFELIDALSGMPGGAQRVRPLPSLTQGADGRLWFAQVSGLAWLDPMQIPIAHAPLHVVIRSVVSGGVALPANERVELPVGTHSFRISYTALNGLFPERVIFRFRLTGSGSDWQFAGNDRIANFVGLGPGHYQFEVEASENGAPWVNAPLTLPIQISPAFYQTVWFSLLCAFILLLAIIYLTRQRIRLSNEQLRSQLQIRHAERERIARDLHDTLLQGVHGLILRIHAAALSLAPDHPVSVSIEKALERGEEILVEGRQRLQDLRLGVGGSNAFTMRITEFAEQCAVDYPAEFNIATNESGEIMVPIVCEESFLITREAVLNAFKHARASSIRVEVQHRVKGVSISVRDDGAGFNADARQRLAHNGRWGVVGMRERAETMGATLTIASIEGEGTEVLLWIPAHVAYAPKR